jgi:hypothetical protein
VPLLGSGSYVISDEWTNTLGWLAQVATTAGIIVFAIPWHARGRITALSMSVIGAGGHAALPAVKPQITLLPYGSLTPVAGSGGTDTSASTGAYQVEHVVTRTITAEVNMSAAARYICAITAESGANAVAGLQIRQIYATIVPELES